MKCDVVTVWAVVDGVAQEKSSVSVTMPEAAVDFDTTIKNFTATSTESTISVTWDDVETAGLYKAYVYDANGKLKAAKTVTANSATFTSKKLVGQTYTVTVWEVVGGVAQEKSSVTVTMPEVVVTNLRL